MAGNGPTRNQYILLRRLEKKTGLKFKGKTKTDASNFIKYAEKKALNDIYKKDIENSLESYFKTYG